MLPEHGGFNALHTTYGPSATPLTTAGCASITTVTQRTHSGPGFLHACTVPRCTTTSPGFSTRVSEPSSIMRSTLPLTIANVLNEWGEISRPRQSTHSKCCGRATLSDAGWCADMSTDRTCAHKVVPTIPAVAPGARSVKSRFVPSFTTSPKSPVASRVAPSVL